MNAKLTSALIKLAADFPDEVTSVMNANSIEFVLKCDTEEKVDVVALAMNGFSVGADAQDVTDVLGENGVAVVSYY